MGLLRDLARTFWDNCWHRFEREYLCKARYQYLEYNVESLMKLGGQRYGR